MFFIYFAGALSAFLNLNPHIKQPDNNHGHSYIDIKYFCMEYSKGDEWYRDQMTLSRPLDVTVEKSIAYASPACIDKVVPRIWKQNHDMKIIMIVRDPVKRLVSSFAHRVDVDKWKSDADSFEKIAFYSNGTVNANTHFVTQGIFYNTLTKYTKFFPMKNILVLDGDLFAKNPIPILNKVEDFLGIERHISTKNLVYSKTKGFYCTKPDPDGELVCLSKHKGRVHPYVRPTSLAKLEEFYRPYNKKFLTLAGMNFIGIIA